MRIHTRHPVELFAAVNVYVLRKRFKTYSMLSKTRTDSIVMAEYTSTLGRGRLLMAYSTHRLTNKEAQFKNG